MSLVRTPLIVLAVVASIAGTASAAEESRNVPAFTSIAYGGSGTIDVTVGKAQSLVLVGDSELLRHITTTVEDGKLRIRTESGFNWNGERLAVRVSLPKLAALSSAGSAHTTITGLKGGETALSISGSGDITATGEVESLSISVSGSGKANLDKLNTVSAAVNVSGSGDVVVQPKRTLAATVSGSGDVRYIGTPQVSSQVHGSGRVRQQ